MGLYFHRTQAGEVLRNARSVLKLFGSAMGAPGKMQNIVAGDFLGLRIRVCEFAFRSGGWKTSSQSYNVLALAIVDDKDYPWLGVAPEGIGHKLFEAVGGADIDFESDAFSRAYCVKSPDRRFAYDVLHPRAIEHLMKPGWKRWEISGPYIAVWEARRRLEANDVGVAIQRLRGFVDLMPQFIQASHRSPAVKSSTV